MTDPAILVRVEQRLQEANRYLTQGRFRSMRGLFEFSWREPVRAVENEGRRIVYDSDAERSLLKITSFATNQIELEMVMPVIPSIVGAENPENNCSVQGFPQQGWYAPDLRIMVLQLIFSSARDDCDQPEQWLLKRL